VINSKTHNYVDRLCDDCIISLLYTCNNAMLYFIGAQTLIVMTREFDPITELSLHPDNSGEGKLTVHLPKGRKTLFRWLSSFYLLRKTVGVYYFRSKKADRSKIYMFSFIIYLRYVHLYRCAEKY
jgi:hypothetical protein